MKSIGSAKKPITEAPFHGEYSAEQVGFRKAGEPSVRSGDRLFLYAPGGSRRIFALAEAVGDPEHDPNYNPNEEGSCRWKLAVRYLPNLNLPVASGILIDDVISHRKVRLTKSTGQKSHIELHLEESESAYHLLHEKSTKRQKLEELRKEIVRRWPRAFLFPARDGVQGFLGASSVMFVAERPSTAKEELSGSAKSLLYPFLEEIGAGDGHLTDAIKTPAKVGEPDPEDIAHHWRFLDREIEIVRPRLIVAFGQRVYHWLQFPAAVRGIEIQRVRHYSHAGRWGKGDAWKAELRKVLRR